MENRRLSDYPNIGVLGEDLVARWLQAQGWVVLHRQWRCRWGELDLIAQKCPAVPEGEGESVSDKHGKCNSSVLPSPAYPLLAFVEVKTRSQRNWDADGLLAITAQKQAKLGKAAGMFLAENPDFVNLPCRFDVALVNCQRHQKSGAISDRSKDSRTQYFPPVALGQPLSVAGYRLVLQNYIESAFD